MLHNYTTWKVAKEFFETPTKNHYLKEISRNIKLAHTSVKQQLEKLEKEQIITSTTTTKGKRKYKEYQANIENNKYKHYKKIYNQEQIFQSKIVEYLQEKLMPKTIVLFGSYQKGEDTETSDIDIYLQCKKEIIDLKSPE